MPGLILKLVILQVLSTTVIALLIERGSTTSPPSTTKARVNQAKPNSQDNALKFLELEKKIRALETKFESLELSSKDDKKVIANLTTTLANSDIEVKQLKIQVQNCQNDVQALAKQNNRTLLNLRQELSNSSFYVEKQIESLKQHLPVLENDIKTVAIQDNQTFLHLRQMLSNSSIYCEKQIEALRQRLPGFAKKETPVAFLVFSSRRTISTHPGAVVFDRANVNIGNAYNTHTGIFTAPVSGIYSFSISLTGDNGDVHGYIKQMGYTMGYVYADDTRVFKHNRASLSVTLHCRKGDRVWFDWPDTGNQLIYGNDFTWFSGHLVHEDQ